MDGLQYFGIYGNIIDGTCISCIYSWSVDHVESPEPNIVAIRLDLDANITLSKYAIFVPWFSPRGLGRP